MLAVCPPFHNDASHISCPREGCEIFGRECLEDVGSLAMIIVASVLACAVLILNIHYRFDLGIDEWARSTFTGLGDPWIGYYGSLIAPWLEPEISPYTTFALEFAQGSFFLPVMVFGSVFIALFTTLQITKYGSRYLDDETTKKVDEGKEYYAVAKAWVIATLIATFLFVFSCMDAGVLYMERYGIDAQTNSWILKFFSSAQENLLDNDTSIVSAQEVQEKGWLVFLIGWILNVIWEIIKGLTFFIIIIFTFLFVHGMYYLYDVVLSLIYAPIVVITLCGFTPGVVAAYVAARTRHPAEHIVAKHVSTTQPDDMIEKELAAALQSHHANEQYVIDRIDQLSPARQMIWRVRWRKYAEKAEQMRQSIEAKAKTFENDNALATSAQRLERVKRAQS